MCTVCEEARTLDGIRKNGVRSKQFASKGIFVGNFVGRFFWPVMSALTRPLLKKVIIARSLITFALNIIEMKYLKAPLFWRNSHIKTKITGELQQVNISIFYFTFL